MTEARASIYVSELIQDELRENRTFFLGGVPTANALALAHYQRFNDCPDHLFRLLVKQFDETQKNF